MKSALAFVGALACIAMAGVPAAAQSCVDLVNPQTGVSDCPARVALCNNPVYLNLMTQQCPRTCGRCSGTTSAVRPCVDVVGTNGASDCAATAHLCNVPAYYSFMTAQCPRTCGRCETTPASQSCVDVQSDCPSRAALCNNSAYYTLMTQQCPKTCGRCPPVAPPTTIAGPQ